MKVKLQSITTHTDFLFNLRQMPESIVKKTLKNIPDTYKAPASLECKQLGKKKRKIPWYWSHCEGNIRNS